jgi:hypothetical protein
MCAAGRSRKMHFYQQIQKNILRAKKFPELEDEILKHVKGLCNNGVGASHEMFISEHAMQNISPSQFKVSRGWMYCFMMSKVL